MVKDKKYDVIIVGGGLVGLTQSILLAQNGVKILCLDQQSEKGLSNNPFLKRTTAISYGSHQILKAANLWDQISPLSCPIHSIEVKDGESPTLLKFDLEENNDATAAKGYGWVIENSLLQKILIQKIKSLSKATYETGLRVTHIQNNEDDVSVQTSTKKDYRAKLLIGADGRQSFVRQAAGIATEEFSYNQNAIISIITHEHSHQNIALEHFNADGPLAILPMTDDENGNHRSSIVYTEKSNSKNSVINWSAETFLIFLKQKFPISYGDITITTTPMSYPLGYVHADKFISGRIALIGDAAHGIHPVAGQGLNLGLRDVAALTELILEHHRGKQDWGDKNLLETYQKSRKSDTLLMSIFTDGLNRIFSNDFATARLGRKIGLKLLNNIKPLKDNIISQSMGTFGKIPNIIKRGKI